MALGGKKGAYIGGKATGDGLTAGTETYMKEEAADRADRKLDIEERRAGKAAKDAAWVEDEDEYGRTLLRNKVTNEVKRSLDDKGQQIWRPNEPIYGVNPSTGLVEARLKYKERPGQETAAKTQPSVQVSRSIGQQFENYKKARLKEGVDILFDPGLEDIKDLDPNGQRPANMTEKQWREKQYIFAKAKAGWDEQISQAAKSKREKAQSTAQKRSELLARAQIDNLKTYRDKIFIPEKAQTDKLVEWLNMGGDTKVENAGLYMAFMKTAQQDPSVIREGDQRTIEAYLDFGTKLSQIESIFRGKGKMSPQLKADIMKFFDEVNRYRQSKQAREINRYATDAYKNGDESYQIFTQGADSTAKGEAKDYAVRELAGKRPLTPQEFKEAVRSGNIGNGSIYMRSEMPGVVLIHENLVRQKTIDPQSGATTFKIVDPGNSTPWRVQ
jgi:hypothetical protein